LFVLKGFVVLACLTLLYSGDESWKRYVIQTQFCMVNVTMSVRYVFVMLVTCVKLSSCICVFPSPSASDEFPLPTQSHQYINMN